MWRFLFRRGLASELPKAKGFRVADGEPIWLTDRKELYVGQSGGVTFLGPSPNAVVSTSADYAFKYGDGVVLADATGASVNVTLPDPASKGPMFARWVKKTDLTGNVVNVLPFGAELVDGGASKVMSSPASGLMYISDGTNWHTF